MFTFSDDNPFKRRAVSCVKLPATAAFPTDDRLVQRIEAARRALPQNNVKALWRAHATGSVALPAQQRRPDVAPPLPRPDVSRAAIERFWAKADVRKSTPPSLTIADLYARTKATAR